MVCRVHGSRFSVQGFWLRGLPFRCPHVSVLSQFAYDSKRNRFTGLDGQHRCHISRPAFFNDLKSKTGLMVARPAALRININTDGRPIPTKKHCRTLPASPPFCCLCPCSPPLCVMLKRTKAESEAQRGKPKGTLESESRNAIV